LNTRTAGSHEIEADVAVVGYGGAGAAAAITAHDNGAKVVILEKMPAGGGNTRTSAGAIALPTSMEAVTYFQAICFDSTEKEIVQTFVESSLRTEDWFQKIGGETTTAQGSPAFYPRVSLPTFPRVPGAEHIKTLHVSGTGTETSGEVLWKVLSTNVERRGIKVMPGTSAKELVANKKGEIVGVAAEHSGEKLLVKAKRAVILTCGGFEYNEAMKEAFLPCKPFHAEGSPGNTGDGIMMAQKAGAALWHMPVVAALLGFKAPEYQASFSIRFCNEGFIYVNRRGNRFCDETGPELHDAWRVASWVDSGEEVWSPCYPNIPAYGVFDDVTRRKGPLTRTNNPMGYNRDYKWSPDNSKEIAKGWIAQASTIRELAGKISVDEHTLEKTVTRYNECCKAGADTDFGRSKETARPIETPPFYAIELWPSLLNTQGGPRRDQQARVVDYAGKPIPRLYAAGELGSIWGFLYNGGGNLAECLAFGRIAGRNAAAEKPRS